MASRRSQRIAIWVIAGVMLAGTIGGFIAMMVAPGNEAKDQAAFDAAQKEWNKDQEERQVKVDEQAKELSKKYYDTFSAQSGRVGPFDAASITELKTEDLVVGDGEEIKDDTKFATYYILWTPKGEIVEQSIKDGSLSSPLSIDGLASSQMIEGWKKGLVGMKIGGVRELSIPSDLAYGKNGSGEKIPADTPLKFIVMAIPRPEEIPEVEMPQLIKDYYKRLYGTEF